MDKEKILGLTPWIELFIRNIYYSGRGVSDVLKKYNEKMNGDIQNNLSIDVKNKELNKKKILKYIDVLDIKKGDLIIIHSSANELSKAGVNSLDILKELRNIVGEEGTIVLPAFPLYKVSETNEEIPVYNPKRTLCSTGMLPNLFLRMPGVVRSQFPWNSLAAQGPLAQAMMVHNLDTDLAHGRGSAWEFCMNHGAKILLLGVKASHTTTMVHVAEDILDNKWPIEGWYESRKFILRNDSEEQEICIRIRKQQWAKYNASWYRSNQLKKQGLLSETEISGVNIGFIDDSKKMVDYIINRTLEHKPFFVVPKRCYKK